MNTATEHDLIARLLEHFEHGTTDAGVGEKYVDISEYLDPERFAAERDTVCAGLPVLIGHLSQLREPGDFLTDTVYGVPVLVTRSAAGELRGFRNVCRHRGAVLVEEAAGNRKLFRCPYHAWQFNVDGALTHVPDRARCFPGLSMADRGLLPVPVFERHGFIWLDLAAQDRPDGALDRFFAALDPDLAGYRFGADQLYGTELLYTDSNWKLVVEAFLEVYHFKALHPQMKSYIFAGEHALQDPLQDHLRLIAPKRELRELRDRPRQEWELKSHATILFFVFPNTFLFVETRHVSTLQVRPVTPARSEVRMMHVANEHGMTESDRLDITIKALMQAMGEDLAVCDSVQRGFAAGPHDLLFGRNELALQHFRAVLDRRLAG